VATGLAGSSPTPPSSSRSSGNSSVPPSQTLSLGEASLQFLAVYFGGEGEQSLSVFLDKTMCGFSPTGSRVLLHGKGASFSWRFWCPPERNA
jgi:hypothetical protein